MNAVVRMCEESTVYLPSFPVADKGLLELEYASMGATRWKKFVSNAGNSGEESIRRTMLLGNNTSSAELYLIPGGRFLLMLDAETLSIWDLLDCHETICPVDKEREPIAIVNLPLPNCNSFTTHRTPDGSGIRIVIMTHYIAAIGDSDIE
jgi:hypothetical protein